MQKVLDSLFKEGFEFEYSSMQSDYFSMAIRRLHVKAPVFRFQHSAAVVATWVGPGGLGPCFYCCFVYEQPRSSKL